MFLTASTSLQELSAVGLLSDRSCRALDFFGVQALGAVICFEPEVAKSRFGSGEAVAEELRLFGEIFDPIASSLLAGERYLVHAIRTRRISERKERLAEVELSQPGGEPFILPEGHGARLSPGGSAASFPPGDRRAPCASRSGKCASRSERGRRRFYEPKLFEEETAGETPALPLPLRLMRAQYLMREYLPAFLKNNYQYTIQEVTGYFGENLELICSRLDNPRQLFMTPTGRDVRTNVRMLQFAVDFLKEIGRATGVDHPVYSAADRAVAYYEAREMFFQMLVRARSVEPADIQRLVELFRSMLWGCSTRLKRALEPIDDISEAVEALFSPNYFADRKIRGCGLGCIEEWEGKRTDCAVLFRRELEEML